MEANSINKNLSNTEIDNEEMRRRHMITVYVLYSILSFINIAYLSTRVLKLTEKKFHLIMFFFLQLCYCSRIFDRYIWNH